MFTDGHRPDIYSDMSEQNNIRVCRAYDNGQSSDILKAFDQPNQI